MKTTLKLLILLWFLFYSFNIIRANDVEPTINSKVEGTTLIISGEEYSKIKIYELKSGALIKMSRNTNIIYLDGLKKGQYIVKVDNYKAFTIIL